MLFWTLLLVCALLLFLLTCVLIIDEISFTAEMHWISDGEREIYHRFTHRYFVEMLYQAAPRTRRVAYSIITFRGVKCLTRG